MYLDGQGEDDGVGVDDPGDSEVLDALGLEDQLTGLEPGDVVGSVQKLGDDAPYKARPGNNSTYLG